MAFHERKYASLCLRLIGLALLAVAVLAARHLFSVADPTARLKPSAYLFALIFMVSTSAGTALAVLGRHLFDQVALSARWTMHVPPRRRSADPRLRDPD